MRIALGLVIWLAVGCGAEIETDAAGGTSMPAQVEYVGPAPGEAASDLTGGDDQVDEQGNGRGKGKRKKNAAED